MLGLQLNGSGCGKQFLKIYGERNTGTQFLSELIRLNFRVEEVPGTAPKSIRKLQEFLPGKELIIDIYFYLTYYRNLGWKHSVVKAPEDYEKYNICSKNLSFVTITKNPYSWLLSLYKRPYHQYILEKKDFETFLSSPWKTIGRDNAPRSLSSPVELRNIKNYSYLQFINNYPVLTIKYEDLLAGPKQVLELLGKTLSYNWKVDQFKNYEKSTKESNKDYNYYRDYYTNERWKDELSR